MTDEPIEQVARAMCVGGGYDPDQTMPNDGPRWKYYTDAAQAAIAAMQPHIEAHREDAARRALESVKSAVYSKEIDARSWLMADDAIRAIDPAQFRRPDDADL